MNKISIIIPAFNQGNHTVNCLKGIVSTCDVDFETILIDDGSTELVYKAIPKLFPNIKVVRNETNLGFIKSTNRGFEIATGTHYLMLNNDTIIKDPKWLKKILCGMQKRGLDMAGVAGGRMTRDWNYIPGEAKKETDSFAYLAGWCLMLRREVIDSIGALSEKFGIGMFDDLDLCIRAKQAGFKMGIVEGIKITHLYHQTFIKSGYNISEQYKKNRLVFLEAHGIRID